MAEVQKYLSTSLQKLEKVQSEVGDVQFQLYEALADDLLLASAEEGIRTAVVDMEDVQRIVGMIQVNLLKSMVENKRVLRAATAKPVSVSRPTSFVPPVAPAPPQAATPSSLVSALPPPPPPTAQPESPAVPAPTSSEKWDVGEWLKQHGLTVVGLRPATPIEEAADELALYLGDHFEDLQDFYVMLKRQVLGGSQHRLALRGKSEDAKMIIRKWGKTLLSKVFLKKFFVDKDTESVVADLQDLPEIQAFIKGEWLERYCFQVVKREAESRRLSSIQIFAGVQVKDDVNKEAEFDLLARGPGERVIWIECKSGQWRNYLSRYHWLNLDHLRLGQERAAMAITEKIDDGQRRNACALSGMTVLHIQDLPAWVRQALQ
jgi:hypothetical protein